MFDPNMPKKEDFIKWFNLTCQHSTIINESNKDIAWAIWYLIMLELSSKQQKPFDGTMN